MAKPKVKFVLNRRAFREQILLSPDVGEACAEVLGGADRDDVEIQASGRIRARAFGNMSDEVDSGALSRRLG